jgi:serine/threonine-protein kinase
MILAGRAHRENERGVTEGGGQDLTGRQLGPYRLEAPLGHGGFGRVYRARHVALDIPRAVKVMQADLAVDPQFRERFLREARTAAQLHHPNIVAVFDFGTDGDIQYLVMEYVESATLADHLSRMPVPGRLGDPSVRRWVRDVGMGLDHAHAFGIVHRDLKPTNVLVKTMDGRAMLTDFGIAHARTDPRLTVAGQSVGTYAYMSPEQCEGTPDPTSASDVYALAAMLYEITTGDPPFGKGISAVSGHIQKPMPALRLKAPDLPSGLDAVLAKGLAKAPGDRYQTAGELVSNFLVAVPERTAEPERAAETEQQPDATVVTMPSAPWSPPSSPYVEPEPPAPEPRLRLPSLPTLPRPTSLPVVAVIAGVAAVVLGAVAVVAIVRMAQPGPPRPPAPVPSSPGLPNPIRGAVGTPMRVGGSRLTVIDFNAQATPPPSTVVRPDAEHFVLVDVRYQAGAGAVVASPYDWVLSDDQSHVYVATVDGLSGRLPERTLSANQSVRGSLGFVVPKSAKGLVLHYDAEIGDQAAQVPLGA